MKKILIIVGALLLVGGAFFGGITMGKGQAAVPTETSPEDEVVADATGGDGHGKAPAKESGGHGAPAKDAHGVPTTEETGDVTRGDLIFQFGRNFVVNMLDPTGRVYLQAEIEIEATSIEARKKLDENLAPLRDATIMLLSNKEREEIQTAAGKERLKRELLARYEGIMPQGTIRNIYFTDLTVLKQ